MEYFKKGAPPSNIPEEEDSKPIKLTFETPSPKKPRQRGLKIVYFVIVIVVIIGLILAGVFYYRNRKKEETSKTKETSFTAQDEDGDGLSTLKEMEIGTNPKEFDTDSDGMPDGWEVKNKLNPLDYTDALSDNDEDQLTNLEEYQYKTDPNKADTDNDGYKDGEEVKQGYNPTGSGKIKTKKKNK